MTFYVNGVDSGTISVSPSSGTSATAELTLSTLNAGSQSIKVSYWGDDVYAAASKTITQTVKKAATTTLLTTSDSPAVIHTPITFTATVSSSVATPGGTVSFVIGGTTYATVPLVAGVATYTTFALGLGNHKVVADYNGTSNYATSNSSTLTPLTQVVQNPGSNPTSTTVSSSANPVATGQPVTFMAQVNATNGGTPTGWVRFSLDGSLTPYVPLDSNGQATVTYASLSVGNHNVFAIYYGDLTYAATTTSQEQVLQQQVFVVPTGLSISASSPNGPDTVTLTVTAVANGATALSDQDQVSFTVLSAPPGVNFGASNNSTSFTNGVATFSDLQAPPGLYQLEFFSDNLTQTFSFTINAKGRLA